VTGAYEDDGARVARLPGPRRCLTRPSRATTSYRLRPRRSSRVARRASTLPASNVGILPVPQLRTRHRCVRTRHQPSKPLPQLLVESPRRRTSRRSSRGVRFVDGADRDRRAW
jgi:hypothetical protein